MSTAQNQLKAQNPHPAVPCAELIKAGSSFTEEAKAAVTISLPAVIKHT
jgi:hypothetical protein